MHQLWGSPKLVRAMGPVVSSTCMRRIILTVWLLILTGCLWAQAPSANDSEEAAIQRAKSALVSSFDSSLPKVSLEFFLNYESGGAPIQWEVNDCGKKIGNPAADRGSDSPVCVVAGFGKDQTAVTVLISVGTLRQGLSGALALFRVTVNDASGNGRSLRRLSDLPMELHRPLPKSPRDLPVPTTASSESLCAAPGGYWRRA